MARESFRLNVADRQQMHEIPDGPSASVRLGPKNDDVEIIEIDDTPEADRGRPTRVESSVLDQEEDDLRERISQRTQKRIDRLKFETETERRGREAAERERDAAVRLAQQQADELATARRQIETGSTALADSMKAERESRITDAEQRLERAYTDGDNAAIAKATRDLSLAQAELVAITSRLPAPRAEQPRAEQQQQREQPQQQQRSPQQAPTMAPNVARWIAHHDGWFGKDKAKTEFAMSLHRNIEARGIRPETDQYTEELDKGLKAVYPDHKPFSGSRNDGDGEQGSGPRRTNVTQGGSRDAPVDGSGSQRVELTSSELAVARRLGLKTPEQLGAYAREKQKREARMRGA